MRQNDISEQMRTVAKELTPEEMHAVAAFYDAQGSEPTGPAGILPH
jgi:cytochrome c553